MTQHEVPFFLARNSGGLKSASAEDDYLHPRANADVAGDSLTETQYFGLCMPKERIHGVFYLWHHPNLKVVSGGVWVWRGMTLESVASEIFDWNNFLSDAVLKDDLNKFTLENSYSVEVVEPLKRYRLNYADPTRRNAIALEYTALAPPVMFGDGRHFEQALKVQGTLTLRGETYPVDSYNIRDRSWGKLRREHPLAVPPMIWMTAVFNESFFFNCTATDHPDLDPDWKDLFPAFPGERTLMGGWIQRDGEVTEIVACRKRTTRDPETLVAQVIEMTVTDSKHRSYALRGEILAASSMATWPNERSIIGMTKWTCDGLVGYGDSQEIQYHDFLRARYAPRTPYPRAGIP